MERIGRVGIQNAQPSAVVVAEWSIGLLGRGSRAADGFRAGANGNIMALHTAEWLKPRKCPSQNRFEIVGFRSCGHVFFSEKALEISRWQLC